MKNETLDYKALLEDIQFGDEEEATAAMEKLMARREEEKELDPLTLEIEEKKRKMDVMSAKADFYNRIVPDAEAGDGQAIYEFLQYDRPKLFNDPEGKEAWQRRVNEMLSSGHLNNLDTYQKAGFEVSGELEIYEDPLSEDQIAQIHESSNRTGGQASPAFLPRIVDDGRSPERREDDRQAIAEMQKAHHGQRR